MFAIAGNFTSAEMDRQAGPFFAGGGVYATVSAPGNRHASTLRRMKMLGRDYMREEVKSIV